MNSRYILSIRTGVILLSIALTGITSCKKEDQNPSPSNVTYSTPSTSQIVRFQATPTAFASPRALTPGTSEEDSILISELAINDIHMRGYYMDQNYTEQFDSKDLDSLILQTNNNNLSKIQGPPKKVIGKSYYIELKEILNPQKIYDAGFSGMDCLYYANTDGTGINYSMSQSQFSLGDSKPLLTRRPVPMATSKYTYKSLFYKNWKTYSKFQIFENHTSSLEPRVLMTPLLAKLSILCKVDSTKVKITSLKLINIPQELTTIRKQITSGVSQIFDHPGSDPQNYYEKVLLDDTNKNAVSFNMQAFKYVPVKGAMNADGTVYRGALYIPESMPQSEAQELKLEIKVQSVGKTPEVSATAVIPVLRLKTDAYTLEPAPGYTSGTLIAKYRAERGHHYTLRLLLDKAPDVTDAADFLAVIIANDEDYTKAPETAISFN